jgi:large conductance mechanosensitive channel
MGRMCLAAYFAKLQEEHEHMGMLKEFRDFAIKGNVVDLAVGIIIGAAFSKIVDSLVGDVIMPLVGRAVGSLDFSNLFVVLGPIPAGVGHALADLKKAGVPVLAYGNFITIVVNFLVLAFVIFMMVRAINRLRRMHEEEKNTAAAEPTPPPEDVQLLREIRDELRNQRIAS